MKPKEVKDEEIALGGNMAKLLPKYADLPEDFKRDRTPFNKLVREWFFRGLNKSLLTPKPGIDKDKALRHLKAIMCSWEPKHEHKEAGVSYLMSLWFEQPK